eukprot:782065-Pelagomonas_calceolata.AAC.9
MAMQERHEGHMHNILASKRVDQIVDEQWLGRTSLSSSKKLLGFYPCYGILRERTSVCCGVRNQKASSLHGWSLYTNVRIFVAHSLCASLHISARFCDISAWKKGIATNLKYNDCV